MKKLFKTLVVATLAALSCFALVACGAQDYSGEYSYEMTGVGTYGVKVTVTVNGDKIEKVAIVESDYIQCSEGWDDKATYLDNEAKFLASFEGKTVAEVKAMKVTTVSEAEASQYNPAGTPTKIEGNTDAITGATQSSGRLILAVQNALEAVK